MPKFAVKTRIIIVCGIIALSLVASFYSQWDIMKYGLIGLLTLISSDSESN